MNNFSQAGCVCRQLGANTLAVTTYTGSFVRPLVAKQMDYCSFKNTLQHFESWWLCFSLSQYNQNHEEEQNNNNTPPLLG